MCKFAVGATCLKTDDLTSSMIIIVQTVCTCCLLCLKKKKTWTAKQKRNKERNRHQIKKNKKTNLPMCFGQFVTCMKVMWVYVMISVSPCGQLATIESTISKPNCVITSTEFYLFISVLMILTFKVSTSLWCWNCQTESCTVLLNFDQVKFRLCIVVKWLGRIVLKILFMTGMCIIEIMSFNLVCSWALFWGRV